MRRKSIVGALALLAVAAMIAAGAISASSGEGGAQGANALVGTWEATISRGPVLPPLKSLQTFTKDQTLVESGSDSLFRSPAYGVWEYIGDRTFATTSIFHRFSTTGVYLGAQKIKSLRQVSPDGETYTATGVFQVLDLDGNVIATGQTHQHGQAGARRAPRPAVELSQGMSAAAGHGGRRHASGRRSPTLRIRSGTPNSRRIFTFP